MAYNPRFFKLPPRRAWAGDHGYPTYRFSDDIAVAVDVALATNRPLLIAGPPGSGKSMLAPAMAGLLGWRFLHHTLTSRSRLEELTGETDQLRRLHDAQAATHNKPLLPDSFYLNPGLLWWAFDPERASQRGATETELQKYKDRFQPPVPPKGFNTDAEHTVLLLDEIDKAEPDLPNDLLEPLDRLGFQVPNGPEVRAPQGLKTLVMITTNGERELPQAFLRRCASLVLGDPTKDWLTAVAGQHFPRGSKTLFAKVADKVLDGRHAPRDRVQRPPSTSEYLDALRACQELKITPDHPIWSQVEQATLVKKLGEDADQGTDW